MRKVNVTRNDINTCDEWIYYRGGGGGVGGGEGCGRVSSVKTDTLSLLKIGIL